MNREKLRIIELTEYETKSFQSNEIPEAAGIQLYQKYQTQVDVEFPNYKTGEKWQLKAKGWVGYIRLTSGLSLKLQPKVPIKNLFGMVEYAYNLKSFRFLEDLMDCESLNEFYNQLAHVLAQRILERCRKGLYRTYLTKTQQLAYLRGRLDVQQVIQKPWDIKFKCHYEEHTPDITENQILAWILYIIGRSGLCSQRVSPSVRKAYHTLQGVVTLQPWKAEDCIGRQYNRLNEDYRLLDISENDVGALASLRASRLFALTKDLNERIINFWRCLLHNLCRFFLDNTAPSHERGDRAMLPFLVDMARLYELFVAEWLKAHLPSDFILKSQEKVNIGKTLHFKTDLELYDNCSVTARYILDTKYKTPASPSPQDVSQVVAYAVSKNCQEVILVYPTSLTHSLNELVGNIRVRSLTFALDDNLERTGQTFLKNLQTSSL
ncbi:MAG: restriction endonuclease [Rhizonema sp. PD38]|nr:restriction endonuclease [Rhizonema sp. PD38]